MIRREARELMGSLWRALDKRTPRDDPDRKLLDYVSAFLADTKPLKPLTSKFVTIVTVRDPDTEGECEVEIRKLSDGLLVGLDGVYLHEIAGTNDQPFSPYEEGRQFIVPDDEEGRS